MCFINSCLNAGQKPERLDIKAVCSTYFHCEKCHLALARKTESLALTAPAASSCDLVPNWILQSS